MSLCKDFMPAKISSENGFSSSSRALMVDEKSWAGYCIWEYLDSPLDSNTGSYYTSMTV